MSTLRINNIEAKSVPASPTLDEKIKLTNSSGDVLVHIDGKTSGITTIGINTTASNITFDANSNIVVTGIITATKFVGTIEPTNLTVSGDLTIADKIIHAGDTNTAIRFPAADKITLETSGTERFQVDSSGNVYVGGVGASATAGVLWLNDTSANASKISQDNGNSALVFGTGSGQVERLRITSGGQIFIGGNTGYNESASLISLATDDSAAANMLSDSSAIYNHNNPAFIHVQNRYNTGDGQEAGIILHSKSSFGGAWAIYGKRTSSGFLSDLIFRNRTASSTSAERLKIASGGDVTVTSGNLVIGTAGKGIDFSAQTATSASGSSATSELLDHYEEGTWTPAIIGTSSNPTYNHSSNQGRYVRIGSQVTLHMLIVVSSVSGQGSGNYGISGLPFSVTSDISSYAMVGVVGYNDVFNSEVNKCYANSNDTITFIPNGVTQSNVTFSGNSFSTGYFGLTLSYHTNA